MSHHDNTDFVAVLDANKVQHSALKADLQVASNHGHRTTNNNSLQFQTSFTEELRRFAGFVKNQQESLEHSAKALFLRADTLANFAGAMLVQESYATVHDLKLSTRKIVDDCYALQDFFTSNRYVLLDRASKADEQLGQVVNCSSLVHECLPKAHLNSSLVCVISDIYNALRRAEDTIFNQNNGGDAPLWQAPSSFQRVTTKYWVKDENLTKLMLTCALEAPLLVYGKKGPLTSTKRGDMKVSDGDKLWDSLATRITSIYFDSNGMSLYKKRLARAEGAQLLRVRWYGTTMPTGHKIIFVELKTHHEKWVANKSVKERASIQERDMVKFLRPVQWNREDAEELILRAKPKMKAEELEKATDLLLRMHNLVVNFKLTACVRSVYDRAAFQSSKSNDLRLTLDREVTLVNERVQRSSTSSGQWCLSDSEAHAAPATVVPFNVFEVKLAGSDPMPTGLAQAQNDSTIEVATKFSKFLTGAAAFNTVSTLPYWAAHPAFFSFFGLDKRGAPSPASGSSDLEGGYNLMGSSTEMVSGILRKGVVIAPQKPARIEPKTYFANERTFVQWISASILLLSISSFMLAAGHYNATAAVISLSAFVLIVYSTLLYFKRLNLLKVRKPYGYFNKVNPIFLTSVVGLAIFLVWADSVGGKDFLDIFSFGTDRRMLLREHENCPREITATKLLTAANRPASVVVDSTRQSFLMTSGDAVYIQPINEFGRRSKADFLVRIPQSHLQGLAVVGDHIFAVSGGPEHTQLIAMAWWKAGDGNERLRVVGSWTLGNSRSKVDGFSFVPSINGTPTGSLYMNMDSSIHAYSVPANNEDSYELSRPLKLRSLNMKGLIQTSTVGDKESNDSLSTMVTFEGVTFFLRSKANVLEAWNLTDGTAFPKIELPATDNAQVQWTGFALDREIATDADPQNGDTLGMPLPGPLLLYLVTEDTAGGQIWRFPAVENTETPSGLFSVPFCQVSMS